MFNNAIDPNVRPRAAFVSLLRELPATNVVWKTPHKSYTAEEMMALIEQGDEVGLRWVTDVLRVSRDLVIRQNSVAVAASPTP